MIHPGTDLKYRITSTLDYFSFDDDNFEISICNRWGNIVASISKDDCFQDELGQWYFTFENPQTGVYYASFAGVVDDEDYIKQERIFTDVQKLTEVGICHCCEEGEECECQCDHKVHYEQIWTVNLDDGIYLVGSDGAYVLTNDGKRIKFKED